MLSPLPSIDFYKTLSVPKNATLPEIRSAHRKLVLKCHPDKVLDQSLKAAKQVEFQNVQRAYETLSDPLKRCSYDALVRQHEIARSNPFEFEVKIPKPDSNWSKTNVKVSSQKTRDSNGNNIFQETFSWSRTYNPGSSHMKSGQTKKEQSKRNKRDRNSQQEKNKSREKETEKKEKEERERKLKEKQRQEKEKKEMERKETERLEKERVEREEKERTEQERKREADEKCSSKPHANVGVNTDNGPGYPQSSGKKATTRTQAEPAKAVPNALFPGVGRTKSYVKSPNCENISGAKKPKGTPILQKPSLQTHKSTPLPVRVKPNHVKAGEPSPVPLQRSQTFGEPRPSNTNMNNNVGQASQKTSQSSKISYPVASYTPIATIVTQPLYPQAVSTTPVMRTVKVNQVNYTQNFKTTSIHKVSYSRTYSHENVIYSPPVIQYANRNQG